MKHGYCQEETAHVPEVAGGASGNSCAFTGLPQRGVIVGAGNEMQ